MINAQNVILKPFQIDPHFGKKSQLFVPKVTVHSFYMRASGPPQNRGETTTNGLCYHTLKLAL